VAYPVSHSLVSGRRGLRSPDRSRLLIYLHVSRLPLMFANFRRRRMETAAWPAVSSEWRAAAAAFQSAAGAIKCHEGLFIIARSHVRYKMVISRKRCEIMTLWLQATNRNSYTAYRIAPFLMTLSDLQDRSSVASLFKYDFSHLVQQLSRRRLTCSVARSLCDSWRSCH